jgi:hypothetical protein
LLRRVYHFASWKYGVENISHRRLKLSDINDLNDPFEFLGLVSDNPETIEEFTRMKAQVAENTGLLCFSEDWKNPVQWSHYADRHRGLCLGFDVPEELLAQVTYVSERLDRVPEKGADTQEKEQFVLKVATTKFSHWSYESEYRLFVRLDTKDEETGHYFFNFSQELALREVIVGLACGVTQADLREALGSLIGEVEVFKAVAALRRFEVGRERWE